MQTTRRRPGANRTGPRRARDFHRASRVVHRTWIRLISNPNAPDDSVRGNLQSDFQTKVPGIQISEHLAETGELCMDKFSILRGVTPHAGCSPFGPRIRQHGQQANPGARSTQVLHRSSAKERPSRQRYSQRMSRYRKASHGAPAFWAFVTRHLETKSTPTFVRKTILVSAESRSAWRNRHRRSEASAASLLLKKLDRRFAALWKKNDQLLEGLDQFGDQAYSMITSSRARQRV